jgi:hypothetical protein
MKDPDKWLYVTYVVVMIVMLLDLFVWRPG